VVSEGPRGQGFKGLSEMLKNYKDLNVWQKSYELCLKIYRITAKFPTLESLTPGILGPSSPTNGFTKNL
jgi:hypothetical protein